MTQKVFEKIIKNFWPSKSKGNNIVNTRGETKVKEKAEIINEFFTNKGDTLSRDIDQTN